MEVEKASFVSPNINPWICIMVLTERVFMISGNSYHGTCQVVGMNMIVLLKRPAVFEIVDVLVNTKLND